MRKLIAIIVALLATSLLSSGQDAERPWATWEPPAAETLDPNAWDLYQLAFSLLDEIRARHREEQPVGWELPPGEMAPAAPPAEEMGPPAGPPQEPGAGPPVLGPVEGPPAAPSWGFAAAAELDVESLRELIGQHSSVYKILEQALMGEASLPPVRSIDQLLPELGDMRHGARMFAARSRLHRLEGRALEAALDAVACVRLGADAQTQRIIVAGLAGLACEEFGLRELQQVLPLLDAGQVHITVVAFRGAIAERKTFPEVLEREAAAWKQAVKELYSRQLTTAQIVALLGDMSLQAAVASTEPSEVWHAVADYYAKMAEEASKPYQRGPSGPPTGEGACRTSQRQVEAPLGTNGLRILPPR